jgi:hypothetical protein
LFSTSICGWMKHHSACSNSHCSSWMTPSSEPATPVGSGGWGELDLQPWSWKVYYEHWSSSSSGASRIDWFEGDNAREVLRLIRSFHWNKTFASLHSSLV